MVFLCTKIGVFAARPAPGYKGPRWWVRCQLESNDLHAIDAHIFLSKPLVAGEIWTEVATNKFGENVAMA